MKLSEQAWQESAKIIEDSKNHPFNCQLSDGSLPTDIFAYYIEQDRHFLGNFGKCHTIIASRTDSIYSPIFLTHAKNCFAAENGIFDKFPGMIQTKIIAPATINLNNYLLEVCASEPLAIAIAAILPCFWVYREVGQHIAAHDNENNPYNKWIASYSSQTFSNSVEQMIDIFDEFASTAPEHIKQQMLGAFYKTTYLEWQFWDDAYKGPL